ncbi:MAG: hypothetical protein BGO98_02690 [Myxococcales bacterium 68-20]|nr:hypothetical protein [Myxococcales bacterium]OJY21749.1 MAG: hypothetical protein BGO98_02690 [Myxococcales bacterium 68-20]
MPPSGTPDPVGDALAWLFIALAIFAALIAIVPSLIVLALEGLAKVKHRPSPPLEPRPSAA